MSHARWLFVDSAVAFGGHEVMLLRWLEELQRQARVTPVLLARANTRLYAKASSSVTTLALPALNAGKTGKIIQVLRDAYRVIKVALLLKPKLCIVAEGSLLSQAGLTLLLRMMNLRTVVYVPLVEPSKNMGFGRGAQRDWLVRHIYRRLPHAWITITAEQAMQLASWSRITKPIFTLPNTVATAIERAAVITNESAFFDSRQRPHPNPPSQAGEGDMLSSPPLAAKQTPLSAPQPVAEQATLSPPPFAGERREGASGASPTQQPLRVLVLGRFDAHQKGLDGLLDALLDSPQLSSELHVNLVGDGPYATEIERRLQQFPVLQKLLSVTPWMDAIEALRQHDVLLLASRYEGVPLVMLEAMALCVPVIASDLPGTRAMLPAECLFAVGDYQHALRLLRMTADTQWRADIVQRNRATFKARASGKAFAQAVDGLTNQLLHLMTLPTAPVSLPDT